ncbi:hypothetical protein GCM10025776_13580 [Corallincola platygyrae]
MPLASSAFQYSPETQQIVSNYESAQRQYCGGVEPNQFNEMAAEMGLETDSKAFFGRYNQCVEHIYPLLKSLVEQAEVALACSEAQGEFQLAYRSELPEMRSHLSQVMPNHRLLVSLTDHMKEPHQINVADEAEAAHWSKVNDAFFASNIPLFHVTTWIGYIYFEQDCGYSG